MMNQEILDCINNNLDTRDISKLVWFFLLIIVASFFKPVRQSFWNLIKCFFNRLILLVLFLAATYEYFVIFLLHKTGFWKQDNIKTTFLWAVFVMFVGIINTGSDSKEAPSLKKILKESLAPVGILLFFFDAHPFGFITELILVPGVFILGLIILSIEKQKAIERHKKIILKILYTLLSTIIIVSVLRSLLFFVKQPGQIPLSDFILAFTLSLSALPFLYVLKIGSKYQQLFIQLELILEDKILVAYAKKLALWEFKTDTRNFDRWILRLRLSTKKHTRVNLQQSLYQFKGTIRREKDPKPVELSKGWNPYLASRFLENEGITYKDYIPLPGYDHYCMNSFLYIPTDTVDHSICYEIEGEELEAKSLKINLAVSEKKSDTYSLDIFKKLMEALYYKALNISLDKEILNAMKSKTDYSGLILDKKVLLQNQAIGTGWHETTFIICNKDWKLNN